MAEKLVEPDFTIGDILAEFESEFGPPKGGIHEINQDDCYTSNELMEIYNISQYAVRAKLKKLKNNGLLVEVKKYIEVLGRPGTVFPVPAYQIKERTNEEN